MVLSLLSVAPVQECDLSLLDSIIVLEDQILVYHTADEVWTKYSFTPEIVEIQKKNLKTGAIEGLTSTLVHIVESEQEMVITPSFWQGNTATFSVVGFDQEPYECEVTIDDQWHASLQ